MWNLKVNFKEIEWGGREGNLGRVLGGREGS